MDTARFTKNDNGFTCENCGFSVLPLGKTSRNHCPKCLCSLHVDVNPGDRACECHGIMDAVFAEPDPKKGYVITYKCRVCGFVGRNKAALADVKSTLPPEQYDDVSALIKLTVSDKW